MSIFKLWRSQGNVDWKKWGVETKDKMMRMGVGFGGERGWGVMTRTKVNSAVGGGGGSKIVLS